MAKVKTNVELKRVNMNLPKVLVDRVEEYGNQVGVNTTNAFIFLLYKGLENNYPIADFQNFENEFIDLLSENLLHDDRFISKLIDMFNSENEEIRKKGSEEK